MHPKSLLKDNLAALDLLHIWHPCTQMHDHQATMPLIPIKRAEGMYLYDFDGHAYMDCISSWWVNLFGHCHPYINQKLKEQIDQLEHVIFAGFSHEPIIRLSQRLVELVGGQLQKCFYADNGSSAIEVALKMAFHAKALQGSKKTKFITLKNAYHGETLGALSLGDLGIYKGVYEPLLLQNLSISAPRFCCFEQSLFELEQIIAHHHHDLIALILEPLVQCAGQMNMYDGEFVRLASKLCYEHGIYLIFDEIAVGFGRTGSMFAYQQCGVIPDFLCLSKGISGGYLPLSVVLTRQEIYDLFYAPYKENKAFLHSHSYTGNALACACANAVLDLFESQEVIKKNQSLCAFIWDELQALRAFSFVVNLRHVGMIFAFELEGFGERFGGRVGLEVYNQALKKGFLLRPLGNTIYLMPPYIITKEQVINLIQALKEIFQTF